MSVEPVQNETWRYKDNRGSGTFTVVKVIGGRVKLRGVHSGKTKTISVATLRGDYERVLR